MLNPACGFSAEPGQRIGDTMQHTIGAQNKKRLPKAGGMFVAAFPVRKLLLRISEGIETWS
jgi:hypothetical protein